LPIQKIFLAATHERTTASIRMPLLFGKLLVRIAARKIPSNVPASAALAWLHFNLARALFQISVPAEKFFFTMQAGSNLCAAVTK